MPRRGERDDSKRYDPVAAASAQKSLAAYVASKGGQVPAAAALGYDQGHISRILDGSLQAPLRLLLRLREETKRPLDELLALPPFEKETLTVDKVKALIEEHVASKTATPSLLSHPTAELYASQAGISRELREVVVTEFGRDAQKTAEEWKKIFRATQKAIANVVRVVSKPPPAPKKPRHHHHSEPKKHAG